MKVPSWVAPLGLIVAIIVTGNLAINKVAQVDHCGLAAQQMENIVQCTKLQGCTFTVDDLRYAKRHVAQCAVQSAP